MVCAFSDAQLYLPALNIRVRVYDVSYRNNVGEYSYSTAKVTRAAGELIADNLKYTNPIECQMNGERVFRLCVEPDGISLGSVKSNTATVTMRDPRVILERGTVDILLDETTLGDVVETYIWPTVVDNDPMGVIKGLKYTDPSIDDSFTEAYTDDLQRKINDTFPRDVEIEVPEYLDPMFKDERERQLTELGLDILEYAGEVTGWTVRALAGMKNRTGGFDIESSSPKDAIQSVVDEFEIDSWVDDDGYLWLGHPDVESTPFVVGKEYGDLHLIDHGITQQPAPISRVFVEGRYKIVDIPGTDADVNVFRARSLSEYTDNKGGRTLFLEPKNVSSVGEIESISESALRKRLFKSEYGRVVINGATKRNGNFNIYDVGVGDHIYLIPSTVDCGPDIPGGAFAIQKIAHEISPQEGWRTSLIVGKLTSVNSVETTTYVTTPDLDGWVDSSEFYENVNTYGVEK